MPSVDPSGDTGALLSLRGVTKDYESGAGVVHALRELDLDIRTGEFVAIVGTSGSGKSTLMNILGCLDRPTRGTYTLAGVDVGARSNDGRALVRNRLIGFIFQGFNLLHRTTALENVELPLTYRGVPVKERRARAMEALSAVGLGDRVHHTPNQLSGGQQQRVAIARALVTSPPLLLADEPTGNLDTRTSLEVLSLLQRLNRTRGITIVLVTHEADIAACANRVITFRDGSCVTDVVSPAPHDAALALAELPPPNLSAAAKDAASGKDAEGARLGGPVPVSVYAAMLVAGLLGALTGVLYNRLILDARVVAIPLVLAFLTEAWVGARFGTKRVGHRLTVDQRLRMSVYYTFTVALLATPVLLLQMPSMPDFGTRLASSGFALVFAVVLLGALLVSAVRFLFLSLFLPRPKRAT
jgi:putative ABC transport system ATP-binding protein